MSNLSELLPAGAGAKSADFVASGTLSSGQAVILKADGTVEAVAETQENNPTAGTPVSFRANSISGNNTATTFDSNSNKVVIAYAGSGPTAHAIVGTVSGTTISFGSEIQIVASNGDSFSATFDTNSNKVVIAYRDSGNSSKGTAVVGTVSGNSISFGAPVVFETGQVALTACTFDSSSNKVIISYVGITTSYYGTAIVGTVSGTAISFGSAVVYESAETNNLGAAFDSNSNKIVLTYNDDPSSDGTAIVGTVSGTSISFGSPVVFDTSSSLSTSVVFDSNSNKVIVAYRDAGNSSKGTAIVGTVSGTSISFGTATVFSTGGVEETSAVFDSNSNTVVVSYRDTSNSNYGTMATGSISGTSISFGTPVVFESVNVDYISGAFDSAANKAVSSYKGISTSYGRSVVITPTTTGSNNTSFIGITDQAIADTATGAVIVQGGVSDKVTGLTANTDYYVQANGTISATVSTVPAGRALSSTSILLEG